MGALRNALVHTVGFTSFAISATTLHVCGMAFTQYAVSSFSDRITSESQLEQVARTEIEELNPSFDADIDYHLTEHDAACAYKVAEGEYGVVIGGDFAEETTLRHELYHIFDGHVKKMENIEYPPVEMLRYLFYQEPQAIIYATTGIEL